MRLETIAQQFWKYEGTIFRFVDNDDMTQDFVNTGITFKCHVTKSSRQIGRMKWDLDTKIEAQFRLLFPREIEILSGDYISVTSDLFPEPRSYQWTGIINAYPTHNEVQLQDSQERS